MNVSENKSTELNYVKRQHIQEKSVSKQLNWFNNEII